jgi:hypothetical protein
MAESGLRLSSRFVRHPHYSSIARAGAQLATHYAHEWAGGALVAPLPYSYLFRRVAAIEPVAKDAREHGGTLLMG